MINYALTISRPFPIISGKQHPTKLFPITYRRLKHPPLFFQSR